MSWGEQCVYGPHLVWGRQTAFPAATRSPSRRAWLRRGRAGVARSRSRGCYRSPWCARRATAPQGAAEPQATPATRHCTGPCPGCCNAS